MKKRSSAFLIKKNGKLYDYRKVQEINLNSVKKFLQNKGYQINTLELTGRHVIGKVLKKKRVFFIKVSTSIGVGIRTQVETAWNKEFNEQIPRSDSNFWVPMNIEDGFINGIDKNYYLITECFDGSLLVPQRSNNLSIKLLESQITNVINFSELVQKLQLKKIPDYENINEKDHRKWFVEKTKRWYENIPIEIKSKYSINRLIEHVQQNARSLQIATRHGDFAPWHIFSLRNNILALIDGENARLNGVEYYDIGYFIQRVWSVLEKPKLAEKIIKILLKRGYEIKKLKTVLAARAIGGYLDATTLGFSTLNSSISFQKFVLNL